MITPTGAVTLSVACGDSSPRGRAKRTADGRPYGVEEVRGKGGARPSPTSAEEDGRRTVREAGPYMRGGGAAEIATPVCAPARNDMRFR